MIPSLLAALAILGIEPPAEPPATSAKAQDRLAALHLDDARAWNMFLDEGHKTKAALVEKPIYVWTNPTRSRGQHGAVFVWNDRGRPVAVGCIFSHPEKDQRMVCHEFHSLATGTLLPERGPDQQPWEPKAAVKFQPLPSAPAVDASPARRLIQMRSLARDFTAHSIDYQMERWELRLLAQPLYRYDKPEGDVVDGALFAFVTSAGTDPEVIVALEARKNGDALAWQYRAIRFSDSNLYVQYLGKEVWSNIRDDQNQLHFNPEHTYRLIRDRAIAELPEFVVEP